MGHAVLIEYQPRQGEHFDDKLDCHGQERESR
jgi:hypothetical protein